MSDGTMSGWSLASQVRSLVCGPAELRVAWLADSSIESAQGSRVQ